MAHTHHVVDSDSSFVIKFYNKKSSMLATTGLKSNRN